MAGKQMRAVVVGASTILGKELTEELNDSTAVAWNLKLLDETAENEAQVVSVGDEPAVIQPLTREALQDADLVFFAGQRETTREFWRTAAKSGSAIVDLTDALEGEPGFLVRSPWISGGAKPDLMTVGVVAAHPAAVMLGLVAARLRKFGLRSISATVLEPASQAGHAGVDELHQQTVSLLSFQSVKKEVFGSQVAFNMQTSFGEESQVQLETVRETVRRHLLAISGSELEGGVRLQVVQAPVFHGYTVSALVETAGSAPEMELREALHGGVVVAEVETAASNQAATESGELLVSLRADASDGQTGAFWLWMAADNVRLAARNAVATAMELLALRPDARVQ